MVACTEDKKYRTTKQFVETLQILWENSEVDSVIRISKLGSKLLRHRTIIKD